MTMKKIALPSLKLPPFSLPAILKGRGREKSLLVIETTEHWIKLAGAEGGRLRFLSAIPAEGQNDLLLSQKLMEVLKIRGFKPAHVTLSHPTHNLTTRILSLPSVDPREIRDIVQLQAVKQTPYTREEITAGFRLLDSDPSGYSRVLVAISHRDTVLRYYRIAELAGLNPDQATLSIEGTRSWFLALMKEGKAAREGGAMLLDVDWSTSELCLFSGEKMVFSRSIGIGLRHLREQAAVMENEFLREVQRSLESGAAEMKEDSVARILLTGGAPEMKDLSAAVSRELNLPCEVLPGPVAGSVESETVPVSFVSTAGLALHAAEAAIDLTPPEVQVRRGLMDRARDLAWFGSLMLALVMLVSLVAFEKIYKKSAYLEELNREFSVVKSEAEGVERLVAKMKLAGEEMRTGGVLDVLRDVTEILPPNIVMTSMEYNAGDESLLVRGVSEEMSAVFQFLTTLEGTPSLEQVKTRNVSRRKVGEKDMADFEIAARVVPGVSAGDSA